MKNAKNLNWMHLFVTPPPLNLRIELPCTEFRLLEQNEGDGNGLTLKGQIFFPAVQNPYHAGEIKIIYILKREQIQPLLNEEHQENNFKDIVFAFVGII